VHTEAHGGLLDRTIHERVIATNWTGGCQRGENCTKDAELTQAPTAPESVPRTDIAVE
jgi:hypothetical protein